MPKTATATAIASSKLLLAAVNDKDRSIEVRRRALEASAPLSLPEVKEAIMEAYQRGERRKCTGILSSLFLCFCSCYL